MAFIRSAARFAKNNLLNGEKIYFLPDCFVASLTESNSANPLIDLHQSNINHQKIEALGLNQSKLKAVFALSFSAGNLHWLGVKIGTSGRKNQCQLRLKIFDRKNGKILHQNSLECAELSDNNYAIFKIEDLKISRETTLWAELNCEQATANNHVALWGSSKQNLLEINSEKEQTPQTSSETYQLSEHWTKLSLFNQSQINPNQLLHLIKEELIIPKVSYQTTDRESSCFYSTDCKHFQDTHLTLKSNQHYSFYLHGDGNVLESLRMYFGTHYSIYQGKLKISLRDLNSPDSNSNDWEIEMSQIQEGAPFEIINQSKAKTTLEKNHWYSITLQPIYKNSPPPLVICGKKISTKNGLIKLLPYNPALDKLSCGLEYFQAPEIIQPRTETLSSIAAKLSASTINLGIIYSRDSYQELRAKTDTLTKHLNSGSKLTINHFAFASEDWYHLLHNRARHCHAFLIISDQNLHEFRAFIAAAQRLYMPIFLYADENQQSIKTQDLPINTLHFFDTGRIKTINKGKQDVLKAVDFIITAQNNTFGLTQRSTFSLKPPIKNKPIDQFASLLEEGINSFLSTLLPKLSIVSILYKKEKEVRFFLESFFRQTYPGEIEIVLIDDCSPDNSAREAERVSAELSKKYQKNIKLIVDKNSENLGNCLSRERGIAAASGEIIFIIDADCVVNEKFLEEHLKSYLFAECDVSIGYINLETKQEDPLEAVAKVQKNQLLVSAESNQQDKINLNSFLNCVTRNFSIKKLAIEEPLFDSLFSYSAKADSGFGWEDIEMGYRLYKKGLKIHFTEQAFSMHISHPPSASNNSNQPVKSIKNFRRLIEKHPELKFIARRWVNDTYKRILAWLDVYAIKENADRDWLDHELHQIIWPSLQAIPSTPKKIISYPWHHPHQYEIHKTKHQFTLLTDLGTTFTTNWGFNKRPLLQNVTLAGKNTINPNNYDLAILHFDENVLDSNLCNGVIGSDWGENFLWCLHNLTIPIVAICHGTPQFYGQFLSSCPPQLEGAAIEKSRQRLVELLGNTLVICNSYQAQREWGFKRSTVIWQGFDPTEYAPATYVRGILSLGDPIHERPHYRGYKAFKKVKEKLMEENIELNSLDVPEPLFGWPINDNLGATVKYRNYINTIRQYSIYFNPTVRSPMPRSRGEAMMAGLVTVSLKNHDVEMFITNQINGFYSDDPEELGDYLIYLTRNHNQMLKIAERSRALAADIFNHDRFIDRWQKIIAENAR
ncbi:MAG TPA: glycosyltransferase [Oligoflexia bacterium]|nr:glycosyltransferase [Oligoflexia bacterium]HMP27043.1 glycosyltransferase [Oligoflexia bacterium]